MTNNERELVPVPVKKLSNTEEVKQRDVRDLPLDWRPETIPDRWRVN